MTHVVRYEAAGQLRIGVLTDGIVRAVPGVTSMAGLLSRDLSGARAAIERASDGAAVPVGDVRLLPRVVTDGELIAGRPDSRLTVPEPELAAVVTATGEILGYTVCDDVSSRDIEGENPLYLPQAKVYAGSCALATGIRPSWEVPDPAALGIECRVTRAGETVFAGETSTARMRRSVPDLVGHLLAAQDFPAGAVLSTGTGIVPRLDFTLLDGDVVEVTVGDVGTLTNPVGTLAAARAASALRVPTATAS
jgi:2-dehydro-3-deoxy-D-arabinonate dehydratase